MNRPAIYLSPLAPLSLGPCPCPCRCKYKCKCKRVGPLISAKALLQILLRRRAYRAIRIFFWPGKPHRHRDTHAQHFRIWTSLTLQHLCACRVPEDHLSHGSIPRKQACDRVQVLALQYPPFPQRPRSSTQPPAHLSSLTWLASGAQAGRP